MHVEGYGGSECAAFLTSGVFLFLAEGFFSAGTIFSSRSGGHARQLPNPQWEHRFTSAKLETRPRRQCGLGKAKGPRYKVMIKARHVRSTM